MLYFRQVANKRNSVQKFLISELFCTESHRFSPSIFFIVWSLEVENNTGSNKPYMNPTSSLVIPSTSATSSAQKNYKKQIEQMKSYILDNTTIDEKTFNKNRNKDWYLSSDELLKYGVIDEVITDLTLII